MELYQTVILFFQKMELWGSEIKLFSGYFLLALSCTADHSGCVV
jgi:hypothetical protein